MGLGDKVFLGGANDGSRGFRGSVAMLQMYATALDTESIACMFDAGRDLVQNNRMAQTAASECRPPVATGCTNPIASNFDPLLPQSTVDDGSCEFDTHAESVGEHGSVLVADEWQRINLSGSYNRPIVLCGVVTLRVWVRSVAMDRASGTWHFDIAAEQKACHFAQPPPTSEHVNFIVIEGGVSVEGWHAGLTTVRDSEWKRISFMHELDASTPVVISQVQTFDERLQFVGTRYFPPVRGSARYVVPSDEEKMTHGQCEGEGCTYAQSGRICSALHMTMATLHSPAEETDLISAMRAAGFINGVAWLGVAVHSNTGFWEYVDGSDRSYLNTRCCRECLPSLTNTCGVQFDQRPRDCGGGGCGPACSGPDPDPKCYPDPAELNHRGYYNGGIAESTHKHVEHSLLVCTWKPGLANASAHRHTAFFLKVQGEGIWCQDGEFFAEYFDSVDLSGNPLATQCELSIPNWRWHSTRGGVPPSMLNKVRSLANPTLFSARWTTRLNVASSDMIIFASTASLGSRIIVDNIVVLDHWEECCNTFTSEPVPLSAGCHTVSYVYRSGYTNDYFPTDSYAQLAWTVGDGQSFGAAAGTNSSNLTITSTVPGLSAEVGWLACAPGAGTIHGSRFQAGLLDGDADLTTTIRFA